MCPIRENMVELLEQQLRAARDLSEQQRRKTEQQVSEKKGIRGKIRGRDEKSRIKKVKDRVLTGIFCLTV